VFVYKSSLNMAAPLSNYTIVEERIVIRFLRSEDVKIPEPEIRNNCRRFSAHGVSFAPR
jgi:hypothetical protein